MILNTKKLNIVGILLILILILSLLYYFIGERFILKITKKDIIIIRQDNNILDSQLIDKVESIKCTDEISCINKSVIEATISMVIDNNSWSKVIDRTKDWKFFKYEAYIEKGWPVDSRAEMDYVWSTRYWQSMDGKGTSPESCISEVGREYVVVHQIYKLINKGDISNNGTIKERAILFNKQGDAVCQQIIEYEKYDVFENEIFNN